MTWEDSRRGARVNACKTLVSPKNTRSATRFIRASRFELPLLGSNQDSPDPESGVLPVTPRGTETRTFTVGPSGRTTGRPNASHAARRTLHETAHAGTSCHV